MLCGLGRTDKKKKRKIMSREELVQRVVQMQMTSPHFAEYCVAHVTDSKHKFLFDATDSEERRLYCSLLQRMRGGFISDESRECAGATATGTERQRQRHRHRVLTLWQSLSHYFTSAAAAGATTFCSRVAASAAVVYGPHMPHMFRNIKDLAAFVEMVDAAPRGEEHQRAIVQFMRGRLPMTEVFLHVMLQLCDGYVYEAWCMQAQKPVEEMCMRGGKNQKEEEGGSAYGMASRRKDAASWSTNYTAPSDIMVDEAALQKGGTVIFLANMLMAEHEAFGRPLRYGAVFEHYILRMVQLLARYAMDGSEALAFVRETVEVWTEGNVFAPATLQDMRDAVGIKANANNHR